MPKKFSVALAVLAVTAAALVTTASAFNAPSAQAASKTATCKPTPVRAYEVAVGVDTAVVPVYVVRGNEKPPSSVIGLNMGQCKWVSWKITIALPGKNIVRTGTAVTPSVAFTPQDMIAGKVKAGARYPVKLAVVTDTGKTVTSTTGDAIRFKKATSLKSSTILSTTGPDVHQPTSPDVHQDQVNYRIALQVADWKTVKMVGLKGTVEDDLYIENSGLLSVRKHMTDKNGLHAAVSYIGGVHTLRAVFELSYAGDTSTGSSKTTLWTDLP